MSDNAKITVGFEIDKEQVNNEINNLNKKLEGIGADSKSGINYGNTWTAGISRALRAINNLTLGIRGLNSVTGVTKSVENSFSSISKKIRAVSKETQDYISVLEKMGHSASDITRILDEQEMGDELKEEIRQTGEEMKRMSEIERVYGSDMATLVQVLGKARGSINDISGGIKQLGNNFLQAGNSMNNLPSIASGLYGIGNALNSVGSNNKLWEGITKGIVKATKNIMDFKAKISSIGQSINSLVSSVGSKIGNAFTSPFNKAKGVIKGCADVMKPLDNGIKKLATSIKKVTFDKLVSGAKKLAPTFQQINNQAKNLGNRLKTSLSNSGDVFKGLTQKLTNFGFAMQGVMVIANALKRAVGGVFSFFKTADNLNTTMRKTEQIFGSASQSIEDYSKAMSKGYNLSSSSLQEMLNYTGNFVQGMGMSKDASIDFSKAVADLSVKLGNWSGIDAVTVMEDINKALVGNREGMDKYGVNILDATLNQYMLKKGIEGTVQSLEQEQLAILTLQYIQEASVNATQYWDNGNRSLANSLQTVGEKFKVIKENIGTGLMGVAVKCMGVINALMDKLVQLSKVVQKVFEKLGFGLGKTKSVSSTVGDTVADVAGGIADIASGAGGATKAIDKMGKTAEKVKKSLMGIDELNVISADNDGGSGSGSDGGGTGGGAGDVGSIGANVDLNLGEPNIDEGWIDKLATKISDALKRFVDIGKPLFDLIGKILKDLGKMIGDVFDVIAPIVAKAIEVVLAFGSALAPILSPIWDGIMDVWNLALKPFADFISDKLCTALDWLVEKFQAFGDWVSQNQGLTTFFQILGTVLGGIATAIGLVSGAMAIWNGICLAYNVVAGVCSTVTTALGVAFNFLCSPITLVVLAIGAVIAIVVLCIKYWDEIKEVACNCWDAIKEWIVNAWEKIKEITSNCWDWIVDKFIQSRDKIKEVFAPIGDWFKERWNNIKQSATDLTNAIKDKFTQARDKIKSVFSTIGDFFKGVWNGITNVFSNVGGWFKDKFSNAVDNVKNVFGKVKDAISQPFEKGKDIIKGCIDKIKGFLNFKWAFPKLKMPHFSVSGSMNPLKWIDEGVPKISVSWYAKGGIMDGATPFAMNGNSLAVGGEAGREAILPLDRNTQWMDDLASKMVGLMVNDNSNGENSNLTVNLTLDGDILTTKVIEGIHSLERRTGRELLLG